MFRRLAKIQVLRDSAEYFEAKIFQLGQGMIIHRNAIQGDSFWQLSLQSFCEHRGKARRQQSYNGIFKGFAVMRNRLFLVTSVAILMLGMASPVAAQDSGTQQPPAREQLQHIHSPRSINEELARLTKDLELTPQQQQQVRPLLQEHHDKIQALLDKNPKASRQDLAPQIHAISDATHREIHALLTDHQKELEKAMVHRQHNGEENRRPAPPAGASPGPSPSGFLIGLG